MKHDTHVLEAVADDESKLYEVHKHWIGLVFVYIIVAIGYGGVLYLLFGEEWNKGSGLLIIAHKTLLAN